MIALAMLAVGPVVRLVRNQVVSLTSGTGVPRNRILRSIADIHQSGLLSEDLARKLMALSATRFVIQALMAAQAAKAIGVQIPLWHLAAAMPFVIIACVVVVTPAGLGVNELSYATALHMFGTPLAIGAQWALANRFLVASSCFVVAACATALLGFEEDCGSKNSDGYAGRVGMLIQTAAQEKAARSRCTVCDGDQWNFVRREATYTSRAARKALSSTDACPVARSCRIHSRHPSNSAKLTRLSMHPIVRRGRKLAGRYGRFFASLQRAVA